MRTAIVAVGLALIAGPSYAQGCDTIGRVLNPENCQDAGQYDPYGFLSQPRANSGPGLIEADDREASLPSGTYHRIGDSLYGPRGLHCHISDNVLICE